MDGQIPETTGNLNPEEPNVTPEAVKIKVNKVEKELPLPEVVKLAEKAAGADEKFREAAALREKASQALDIVETVKKLQTNFAQATEEEINKYCDFFQIPEKERLEMLYGPKTPQEPQVPTTPGSSEVPTPPTPVTKDQLDPQLQKAVDAAMELKVQEEERKFTNNVEKMLDSSEEIGKIVKGLSSEGKKDVFSSLHAQVRNEVIARMQAGQQYGDLMVKEAVENAVKHVTSLGRHLEETRKSEGVQPPGFGAAPNSLGLAFKGDKPPERVAGKDPNYTENFIQRLAYKVMHSGK